MPDIEQELEHYLNLPHAIIVRADPEGGFTAEIPDLRGCMAHAESWVGLFEAIKAVKRAWVEIALERGWEIPEPSARTEPPTVAVIGAEKIASHILTSKHIGLPK